MLHIRQKNSIVGEAYTIVQTKGYGGQGEPPLSEHPSLVEHPDLFELVDEEIPTEHQYLKYDG